MDVYENLKAHGIELPEQLSAAGLYKPVNQTGNLLFVSGQGSMDRGKLLTGRVGVDATLEEAQYAARVCAINTLSALEAYLGDLNRIKRCVKVLGFVNCTDDFTQQPQVINGGSNLLFELFGEEKGLPARTAMGTNSCPGNIAVEIEMLVEYE